MTWDLGVEYVDADESGECEYWSEVVPNVICEYEAIVKTVRMEVECKAELPKW